MEAAGVIVLCSWASNSVLQCLVPPGTSLFLIFKAFFKIKFPVSGPVAFLKDPLPPVLGWHGIDELGKWQEGAGGVGTLSIIKSKDSDIII